MTGKHPQLARLTFLGFSCFCSMMASSLASASIIDSSGTILPGDFDGDGNVEVVVSSPETNCAKGAIYVISSAPPGLVTWTRDSAGILGTAACNDYFGASLAVADINGDGRDDLAIAVPNGADSGVSGAGAIHIIYGSATGLTATGDQIWHQDSTGIEGVAEVNDHFGDALEAGDFNCDGFADIAIGVPREAIGSTTAAGAVHVLYGSSSGLSNLDDIWYQGTAGVDGAVETNDSFGASLAHGNFNGDAVGTHGCDDLAVGAPYEDIGTVNSAGFVYIIDGSSTGLETIGDQSLHQNLSGVADTSEANDLFGWRLAVTNLNDDAYDDLLVDVPGDACGSGPGVGRHVFYGGASGVQTTGNAVSCYRFECSVYDDTLGCHVRTAPVYGRSTADAISMFVGRDIVWGLGGDDESRGDQGDDVLFGGAGNDSFDGGPGRDALIGGDGNDVFVIDATCEIGAGEVIDGGPGTDTIRSHLSQSVLLSLGLTIVSVESFVVIGEDPLGSDACDEAPVDDGPFLPPKVALSWTNLPSPSSTTSTTTGIVPVQLSNRSNDAVSVILEFELAVRGEAVPLSASTITVAANTTTTYNLDLNDFIPFGIDPNGVPPELLVLPNSAAIRLFGRLSIGATSFGSTIAPTIYGHIENGTTAVLYREGALRDVYHDGDLAGWRASGPGDSGEGTRLGMVEITGSLGIP